MLTRAIDVRSRDFDYLAQRLVSLAANGGPRFRVVTYDVVGRGDSSRLEGPDGYSYATYMADAFVLIARVTAG